MKRLLPLAAITLCAAAVVLGLLQLFKLRFDSGDVYPPYSSLRADPLGTMAFFESLDSLPGISATRDFSTRNQLPNGYQTAYLHLASRIEEWQWMDEKTFDEVDRFVASGGRLVITFYPDSTSGRRPWDASDADADHPPSRRRRGTEQEKETKPEKRKSKPGSPSTELGRFDLLRKRWGVELERMPLTFGHDGKYTFVAVTNSSDLPFPARLDWHSGIVLRNPSSEWDVIFRREQHPVMAERRLGRGTLVLATDSFFLSNEALRNERQTELLAWLVGSGRRAVFDEAHLGVAETPGLAALLRQYRLAWVGGGFVLLALLFIWKNSMSLVPARRPSRGEDVVSGKDAASGFINLLRRNISRREILPVCFSEWKKTAAAGGQYSSQRLAEAEARFAAASSEPRRQSDPLQTYRAISDALRVPVSRGAIPKSSATRPQERRLAQSPTHHDT